MTNKEAIEILKPLTEYSVDKNGIGTFPIVSTPLQAEALDLAIKALEEPEQGRFECRMKIKNLISMLLEFDMNEKATICTTDEYKENNIVISITDMRGKEE